MPIAVAAEKTSLAAKYAADAVAAAIFTADPGATGTVVGECTGGSPAYARKAITWAPGSAGVTSGTVTFDVAAGTTVTYAGVCSSAVAGTSDLRDKVAVTSQNFATQGTYVLTLTFTES